MISGGGETDKEAGAMPMATSNSYLLSVGGGARFTVIMTEKRKKGDSENIERVKNCDHCVPVSSWH